MSDDNNVCECGEKPIYYRRHEGKYYCKSCLTTSVERKFRKTTSKFVAHGDRIAVALSGGKDSAVLLGLMHKFFADRAEIFALIIDEGIAGYRDKSIERAKTLTRELNVEYHIVSFKDAFDVSLDEIKTEKYCTYCGVFRRDLLNKAAKKYGATKIVIGHNLDDESQSIIINFFKGDQSKFSRLGSASTGGAFVQRVKPLRGIPEKEIMLYAMINDIPFYDGECPHSRNNMRRDVQTMINDLEEKYPGTKNQIVSFYDRLNTAPEKRTPKNCELCDSPTSQTICKSCELQETAKSLQ